MPTFFSLFTAPQPGTGSVLVGLQIALGLGVSMLLFLIFWTLKDILQRSSSLLVQLLAIATVTLLPIVGFFLYLLLRPAATLRERRIEAMLTTLMPPAAVPAVPPAQS